MPNQCSLGGTRGRIAAWRRTCPRRGRPPDPGRWSMPRPRPPPPATPARAAATSPDPSPPPSARAPPLRLPPSRRARGGTRARTRGRGETREGRYGGGFAGKERDEVGLLFSTLLLNYEVIYAKSTLNTFPLLIGIDGKSIVCVMKHSMSGSGYM